MVKLLIAVDGSKHSARVIDYVLKTRDWYKDGVELDVLNVQHPTPYSGRVSAVIGHDKIDEYHREEGMAVLKPAMQALDAAKVKYRHHIGIGEPAQVIADFAKRMASDQIVMGTHGVGAMTQLAMGSVAAKVIALAPIPVLLVR